MITCGTNKYLTKVESGDKWLKGTVGAANVATPNTPACAAGEIKMTVRNYVNKNAKADCKLNYLCLACAADCTPAKTMITPGENKVCGAAAAKVTGALDLGGSGTMGHCGVGTGVHTPNIKNMRGSFTFTPSFPGMTMYAGAVGVADFKTGAAFDSDSVC